MEKHELDEKIAEVSQVVHRYCISRTANVHDAEDLAQEMLVEIYKSAANIRDDKAFYGFMWSVAGNVYKQWYKKKLRVDYCQFTEEAFASQQVQNTTDEWAKSPEDEILDGLEESADIRLLRRELTLLSEKYRRATILYYLENRSCSEIAEILSVSESMVKYLLFKSRQIVKDGMNMERTYGVQSYNPKEMSLLFWGGRNNYSNILESKITQNILFSCYNDKLTGEQISLEIGVALPYMEEHLRELAEYDLLKMDGNRYYTNIVIFTKEFTEEADAKTMELKRKIADLVKQTLAEKEEEIRAIGFFGCNMDCNTFNWQMACILLDFAIVEKLESGIELKYPKDKFGEYCFVWGQERFERKEKSKGMGMGRCQLTNDRGHEIKFMDFQVNGEIVHHYFFNEPILRNIFGDIAAGLTDGFSENDKAAVADMVKRGYVKGEEGNLKVNAPVFTKEEFEKLCVIFDEAAEQIAKEAEGLMGVVSKILKNHAPAHLRRAAAQMSFFRLMGDGICGPLSILYEEKYLLPAERGSMLPTTYVKLK